MKTNMNKSVRPLVTALAAALALALALPAAAAPLPRIAYEGSLRDANGNATLDRSQTVTFRLYTEPSGGTVQWGRIVNVTLDATTGDFNVALGDDSGNTVDGAAHATLGETFNALRGADHIYLGLEVSGSSGEISPRQEILPVAYASFASDVSQASSDFTVGGALAVTRGITAPSAEITGEAKVGGKASVSGQATFNSGAKVVGNLDVTGNITGKGAIPAGVIVMWSGSANEIPSGWALCDGKNNTPDLRGRFIVGVGTLGSDTYNVRSTGGEARHRLSLQEMPRHNHKFTSYNDDYNASNANGYRKEGLAGDSSNAAIEHSDLIEYVGDNKAHENRPPYYALCFIMRLP